MIRTKSAVVLLNLIAFSAAAQAQTPARAAIVKDESKIEFHASSTFAKVVGEFVDWDANLQMGPESLKDGTLALDLKSNSVHTGSGLKDKEVKGKNFFNVKDYPCVASRGRSRSPSSSRRCQTGTKSWKRISLSIAATLG